MTDACEICGATEGLRWDHSHKTGLYRGTLCNTCNMGLGSFGDDVERLRAAVRYVEERGA